MRNHLYAKYGRRYLLIGITAAVILLVMIYSFVMSNRMLSKYGPLVNAAMQIKLEATVAHLWFEEILAGDRSESIETVISHIDRSLWFANVMLAGGAGPDGVFLPLDDPTLEPKIAAVIDRLQFYRQMTFKRYQAIETSGPGSPIDQQYDKIFKEFNADANQVATLLRARIAAEKRLYQELQSVLILIVLLLGGLILIVHLRFDRRHEADLAEISREIEVRKAAEQELLEMNTLKDGFISIASHELRTPLSVITGFSELLLENWELDPEQQRECLRHIQEKALFLNRIVEELLDVSRLESGHPLSIEKAPVNIAAIATAVVQELQTEHDQHTYRISFDSDPALVLADPDRLQQVFENLVGNAVKYSPGGGCINVNGERQGDDYKITVADEGIGMSSEQLQQIFRKYYRANHADNAVKGLGIGLYFVKGIIELHGGRIWASSAPGKGSQFHFTLPLVEPAA